jgi:hypothetical protein
MALLTTICTDSTTPSMRHSPDRGLCLHVTMKNTKSTLFNHTHLPLHG